MADNNRPNVYGIRMSGIKCPHGHRFDNYLEVRSVGKYPNHRDFVNGYCNECAMTMPAWTYSSKTHLFDLQEAGITEKDLREMLDDLQFDINRIRKALDDHGLELPSGYKMDEVA